MSGFYQKNDAQLVWLEKTLSDALNDDSVMWTLVFGH